MPRDRQGQPKKTQNQTALHAPWLYTVIRMWLSHKCCPRLFCRPYAALSPRAVRLAPREERRASIGHRQRRILLLPRIYLLRDPCAHMYYISNPTMSTQIIILMLTLTASRLPQTPTQAPGSVRTYHSSLLLHFQWLRPPTPHQGPWPGWRHCNNGLWKVGTAMWSCGLESSSPRPSACGQTTALLREIRLSTRHRRHRLSFRHPQF